MIKVGGVIPPAFPYTMDFDNGARIIVEAKPRLGYAFKGWSGDLEGEMNPASVIMDCTHEISASFGPDWVLIGTASGSIVMVIFLGTVLIITRKQPKKP